MRSGATLAATAAYCEKIPQAQPGHFRQEQNLWFSSIGLGTYLGQPNEITDLAYQLAITRAIELGCNVLDSAINYRSQRSERIIGTTLKQLFQQGKINREEIIIATKGGFLPFDSKAAPDPYQYRQKQFIDPGIITQNDIVADCHCMTPAYLENQLEQSLQNLNVDKIDIYYLHNPETQLQEVSQSEFYHRIQLAFEFLEKKASDGKIAFYGTSTWNGYRQMSNTRDFLDLTDLVKIAKSLAGESHHFRFIQLPYNLAMPEAFTITNQTIDDEKHCVLEAAKHYGLTVMSSASILQSRLAHNLPKELKVHFPGLKTDAQRSIQFVRSTPGVTTALVGMSQKPHVEENLSTASISPIAQKEFLELFEVI